MKKAYVKPVFLAEEFIGTTNVAVCAGGSINTPVELQLKQYMCYDYNNDGTLKGDNGHIIGGHNGKTDVMKYWDAAGANKEGDEVSDVYLFTDANVVCDFLWSGEGSNVKGWSTNEKESGLVWNEENRNDSARNFFDFGKKLLDFFCGAGADNVNHNPGYNGYLFFS